MVFYLKYRPQTLSELVGQKMVADTLEKSVLNNKAAHAYLFYGPRGVGKTSTARILAKMVNCDGESKPCNTCFACLSISDGSNLDFIEIDAASNRGIDDIRDLRDKIKLSASNLKKKVYIIDEVHMLTTEAFNALLKTLEEPPAHVLFILATTEIQKVPQTILSRVQRLDFKGPTSMDIAEALKRVVKGEKLDIDDEALALISQKSDGSFRDGVKLLDQLASQNQKITKDFVEQTLGLSKTEVTNQLIKMLIQKDSQASLNLVSQAFEQGSDPKEFLNQLLESLRSVLLIKHGALEVVKRNCSEESLAELSNLAELASSNDLVRILKVFEEASEKRKFSSIPSLPIEIGVVESCLAEVGSVSSQPHPMSSLVETSSPRLRALDGATRSLPPTPVEDLSDEKVVMSVQGSSSNDMSTLQDKWNYVLETIHPYNFSLEALLRVVKIGSCQDAQLILKVPYAFHQRILETPRNREMVESVVSDILGKKILVNCELDQTAAQFNDMANVDVAADDEVIRIAAEIFNS